jgi:hypothetical protein
MAEDLGLNHENDWEIQATHETSQVVNDSRRRLLLNCYISDKLPLTFIVLVACS